MPHITVVIELPDAWSDDAGRAHAAAFNGSTYFGHVLADDLAKHDARLVELRAGNCLDHLGPSMPPADTATS